MRPGWMAAAGWMIVGLILAGGCQSGPDLEPTTQPESADSGEAPSVHGVRAAIPEPSTTQPEEEVVLVSAPATQPAGEPAGEPVVGAGGEAPVRPGPDVRLAQATVIDQDTVWPGPGEASVRVGLPPGVKAEFTMPGKGSPPAAGDARDRQRAAFQAAVVVAIYNVTKELNEQSYTDPVDRGYVNSDHFRYTAGLEVKSQTVVIEGRARQFDIWLVVPADEKVRQGRFEVHVRNFVLQGRPLTREQVDRLLRAAGGHLAVLSVDGPDEGGLYTAQVGLIRRAKR